MRLFLLLACYQAAVALRPAPSRRAVIEQAALLGASTFVVGKGDAARAATTYGDDVVTRGHEATFKAFDDPLFSVEFPSDFFKIRRTIGGDIVRRGGVIFTAGQLKTAEIVTVELYPVSDLLKQADALPYFPGGKIAKWGDLGNDKALGELLCERRDNEANSAAKGAKASTRASNVVPGTLSVAGDVLQADLATSLAPIDMRVGEAGTIQKSTGVRRVTRGRLYLLPGGTEIMSCWAGCLDDYWQDGEKDVLAAVVASFKPKKTDAPILAPPPPPPPGDAGAAQV